MLSERVQGVDVCGDGVIRKVSCHHLPQPLSLFCNRVVPPALQLIADVPQRRAHAVAPAVPAQQESAIAPLPADVREPEKVEGLRVSRPARLDARQRTCRTRSDEFSPHGELANEISSLPQRCASMKRGVLPENSVRAGLAI
jgi:hypothetical protein